MVASINASTSAGVVTTADTSGILQLQTANTAAVTIDASQNVGIGTASPSFSNFSSASNGLEIKSASTFGILRLGGTNGQFYVASGDTNGSAWVWNYTNSAMIFGANNTERMRINAGAPILCLSGGSTTATGTGIAFPATQSASSDANTLDDYEEGTWTPTFNFSGSSTGITYGYQIGYYTKVGRVVTVQCYVQFTNKGSASGGLRIDGLPFTAIAGTGSQAYCASSIWANALTGTVGGYMGFVQPNNTYILPYYSGTGSVTQITNTNCNNNTDFMLNATYVTNT